MKIGFHGAAGGVTGSCFLVTTGEARVLIDCGLYQGGDEERDDRDNHDAGGDTSFGFDPASIDYVLLTHAHLDHCGRLPLLAKAGFRGEVLATSATRDLARLVLLDAARLQAEDAHRDARRRMRRGAEPSAPIYDELDVLDVMDRFGRSVTYDQTLTLCPGIRVTYRDAGHILGSASVLLEVDDQGEQRRLLFSGDLGTGTGPILNAPEPAPQADVVVMESTYGDRLHKPIGPTVQELKAAILDTIERGGNVVIPTFALERAQEVLFHLHVLVEQRELPRRLDVFLDSPMAISATAVFRRHLEAVGTDLRAHLTEHDDPFGLPCLQMTRDSAESMAINQIRSGAVILAGSGMATGGRVLHHLKHNLWRPESSIVFVGYAAAGTLARRIIDGQREVRIFGEAIRVAARIYTIGGFSAHADRDQLLGWYRAGGSPTRTFLVHGEDRTRQGLASVLRGEGRSVELPELHAAYDV